MGPISERAERHIRQVFKKKPVSAKREDLKKRADKLMDVRKSLAKKYKGY